MTARNADVIVIGGGVAGLTVARVLAERRARVLLLEQAPLLASAASGNNAAIFRPFEEDAASTLLPRRSRELLERWFGPELLDPVGLVLASAERAPVQRLAVEAARGEVAHAVIDRRELEALAPSLAGGEAQYALHLPGGGVLDVPALTAGLAARARELGAELRTEVRVGRLLRHTDRIEGVVLADGTRLRAAQVVLAGGAWTPAFAERDGLGLPLRPLRRHLLQLTAAADLPDAEPVVWRLEDEIYYRRRGPDLLASPCDETLAAPEAVCADPRALDVLRNKLARVAPRLEGASVQRGWACLRTFATDRELVVGRDPRVEGLHWFAGLGGRGMSVAPAAAECLASIVLGANPPPTAAALTPARLIPARSSADRTA